jgi:hypothetical protein
MTSKISYVLGLTSTSLATGQVAGLYHAELQTSTGAVYNSQDNALPSGEFTVVDGNYNLVLSRRDTSGNTIGTPFVEAVVAGIPVVVVPVATTADIPSSVTVTVTPE